MTKRRTAARAKRNRYTAEFKQQALFRAVKDSVLVMARDLGLPPAQLYALRSQEQRTGHDAEPQRLAARENHPRLRAAGDRELSRRGRAAR
jgi:transposase-like protein